jgi:ligand-binding sensor domain-containing protein
MLRKMISVLICLFLFASIFPASAQSDTCNLENGLLIGTLAYGVNCLDDSGWHSFVMGESTLPTNNLSDVAVCPDNTVYALHALGISVFDGSTWQEGPKGDFFAPNDIACGLENDLWVAHMNGLDHYIGGEWAKYTKDQFGTSPFIIGVEAVETGTDGSVWALTSHSVSKLVEGEWQVYENGSGYNQDYSLSDLLVDESGNAWVLHSTGLLSFDGSAWQEQSVDLLTLQNMAVDAEGNLWVGSFSDGAAKYNGSEWEIFTTENSDLSSSQVRSLAVDAQGRVWIGTEFGLNVFDGEIWTTFTMSNSSLLDNAVHALHVMGDGPTLPALEEKGTGSVIGVIENGRDPLAGAQVELCAESVGVMFSGNTPCDGQRGSFLTTTDDKGEFTFDEVPVGRYELVIEAPDGWISFIGIDTKFEVVEGETTDLEDIDVSN